MGDLKGGRVTLLSWALGILPKLSAAGLFFSGKILHFKSSLAFLLLGKAVILSAEKPKPWIQLSSWTLGKQHTFWLFAYCLTFKVLRKDYLFYFVCRMRVLSACLMSMEVKRCWVPGTGVVNRHEGLENPTLSSTRALECCWLQS